MGFCSLNLDSQLIQLDLLSTELCLQMMCLVLQNLTVFFNL